MHYLPLFLKYYISPINHSSLGSTQTVKLLEDIVQLAGGVRRHGWDCREGARGPNGKGRHGSLPRTSGHQHNLKSDNECQTFNIFRSIYHGSKNAFAYPTSAGTHMLVIWHVVCRYTRVCLYLSEAVSYASLLKSCNVGITFAYVYIYMFA